MALCPQVEDIGLVGSVIDTVDCHIRILVQDSYRNLVGPDTWFAVTFTAMLTIYIALIGYQLMLGRGGLRVTAGGRQHTVVSGDTLSKIAKTMYGDAMKYPVIFEANKPMLKHPDKIYPGQLLRIPA